jgi:DNA uptake protein ComE-like DNA-binding protein
MKTTALSPITVPAVRFGATHGYRFTGDTVELNATFAIVSRSAHERAWALQLWACPSVPARSDDLVGHLVAEAPLPPIVEIAGEAEAFATMAAAQPPAGDRDYSMVLVLVARRGGDFDEVHDVASFPERERFVLPRLAGPVSYRVAGDRVHLDLAAIENPRDAANISGTISVELWALFAPYSGGNFTGSPLAGAVLGTLAGQDRWSQLALELPYTPPAAGAAHVVVMVREWTGAGYTTRDFANLGVLPAAAPAPAPAPHAANLKSQSSDLKSPAPAAAPVVATTAAAPAAKPIATAAAAKPAPASVAAGGKVSLNSATIEQLLTVKGLPRAVAERIVRDRPFKAVDDIINVKGMGEKLLAKIRGQLTL